MHWPIHLVNKNTDIGTWRDFAASIQMPHQLAQSRLNSHELHWQRGDLWNGFSPFEGQFDWSWAPRSSDRFCLLDGASLLCKSSKLTIAPYAFNWMFLVYRGIFFYFVIELIEVRRLQLFRLMIQDCLFLESGHLRAVSVQSVRGCTSIKRTVHHVSGTRRFWQVSELRCNLCFYSWSVYGWVFWHFQPPAGDNNNGGGGGVVWNFQVSKFFAFYLNLLSVEPANSVFNILQNLYQKVLIWCNSVLFST